MATEGSPDGGRVSLSDGLARPNLLVATGAHHVAPHRAKAVSKDVSVAVRWQFWVTTKHQPPWESDNPGR
jgi:hypothetical protein